MTVSLLSQGGDDDVVVLETEDGDGEFEDNHISHLRERRNSLEKQLLEQQQMKAKIQVSQKRLQLTGKREKMRSEKLLVGDGKGMIPIYKKKWEGVMMQSKYDCKVMSKKQKMFNLLREM